jgi:hypothetical protein
VAFTISNSSGLLKSYPSGARETSKSFSAAVGGLDLDNLSTVQVPTGAVAQVVPMPVDGMVAAVLYLRTDHDLTVFLSGSTTPFTLKGNGYLLLLGCAVSSISVSNLTSGSAASLEVYVAGPAS